MYFLTITNTIVLSIDAAALGERALGLAISTALISGTYLLFEG